MRRKIVAQSPRCERSARRGARGDRLSECLARARLACAVDGPIIAQRAPLLGCGVVDTHTLGALELGLVDLVNELDWS